jgi:DNA (cytosine-5)-methyltransferase 1
MAGIVSDHQNLRYDTPMMQGNQKEQMQFQSVEICAGGGGQSLGLERAGFHPIALYDNDKHACATLRHNRPNWNVCEADIAEVNLCSLKGKVDLFAGGVPCPPFSRAGKQMGENDERDLFPHALRLIGECEPNAILLENVRGLMDASFGEYRAHINNILCQQGYNVFWQLLNARDFGVSQQRIRSLLVAFKTSYTNVFCWPAVDYFASVPTVGKVLYSSMASKGWLGAEAWQQKANKIAPTIVGGSKKHGGPDLGPTGSKKAWAEMGVDALVLGNEPPEKDFVGMPRLTVEMVAILQGFPKDWHFCGAKTNSYRQVGNAFPPPMAEAVGKQIYKALES